MDPAAQLNWKMHLSNEGEDDAGFFYSLFPYPNSLSLPAESVSSTYFKGVSAIRSEQCNSFSINKNIIKDWKEHATQNPSGSDRAT
ncbi:hypothetical protein M8J75_004122 [Diaphorina citri]|nr:hypothetical protein M8J75_004122 [Diaphorina citri]